MKFNIINLIDNFNKFNKTAISQHPSICQGYKNLDYNTCINYLKETQNCLILEQKPSGAIKLFNILLENRRKGIVITRHHPDMIRVNLNSKKIDMYWLSTEDFDYVIRPWEIRLLIETVKNFINNDRDGIILLNGLEYLSTYNDSNIISDVIFRMVELVNNSKAKFLITIDPIALGSQFLNSIETKSELTLIPKTLLKEVLN